MKRYLLATILIGNLAVGMDDPKNLEKAIRLNELIVKIHRELSGYERKALASQIICLRQELGIKELYQDLPPGSYTPTRELDAIIAQLPAPKVEQAPASVPVYGSHPLDSVFDEIYRASKEELVAKYPNPTADSAIGKAVIERMSKLQDIELKHKIACAEDKVVKEFGPVDNMVSEYILRAELDKARTTVVAQPAAQVELPDYEQIPKMNKDELMIFKEAVLAQEGKINHYLQSQIDERLETIAIIERENARLSAPEAAVAARALSPKKVHFEGESSDPSESVSARPKPAAALVFQDSSTDEDMPALEKVPQMAPQERGDDSRVMPSIEDLVIRPDDIPAPFEKAHFVPEEKLPQSDSDSDFEERIQMRDEDLAQTPATPAPSPLVIKQPIAVEVPPLADPLSASPRLQELRAQEGSSSPAPEAPDSPNMGELTDQDTPKASHRSASPAPLIPAGASVAKQEVPDTRDDARVAAELTEQFAKESKETPGRPETSKLPVKDEPTEPVVPAGAGTISDLKARAHEDQTPGGPEDTDEPEVIVKNNAVPVQPKSEWSATQKVLATTAVVVAVYSGTEMALAYKSISHEDWNKTSGFMNKLKLVLGKTWHNLKSRPSQMANLAKQVPAMGSSLLHNLKKTARAA